MKTNKSVPEVGKQKKKTYGNLFNFMPLYIEKIFAGKRSERIENLIMHLKNGELIWGNETNWTRIK